MTKPWLLLLAAGILEIGWAVGLKYTYGFSRLVPSVLTITCMVASMTMLAIALKHIPVGTGYAIWTGIGTVGAAILGIILFGESASMVRLGSIALILVGIAGLKLST